MSLPSDRVTSKVGSERYFWKTMEIEAKANDEGKLAVHITKEDLLEAIRNEHQDHQVFPEVTDIKMHAPIVELGLEKFYVVSSRGTEEILVWILPTTIDT